MSAGVFAIDVDLKVRVFNATWSKESLQALQEYVRKSSYRPGVYFTSMSAPDKSIGCNKWQILCRKLSVVEDVVLL